MTKEETEPSINILERIYLLFKHFSNPNALGNAAHKLKVSIKVGR